MNKYTVFFLSLYILFGLATLVIPRQKPGNEKGAVEAHQGGRFWNEEWSRKEFNDIKGTDFPVLHIQTENHKN